MVGILGVTLEFHPLWTMTRMAWKSDIHSKIHSSGLPLRFLCMFFILTLPQWLALVTSDTAPRKLGLQQFQDQRKQWLFSPVRKSSEGFWLVQITRIRLGIQSDPICDHGDRILAKSEIKPIVSMLGDTESRRFFRFLELNSTSL